jgi:inosine-uridine nucleoside N-ribohydrolase
LVLRSPELKLLGVTTTFGDTDLRAKLVTRYLGSLGRFDINVIPGVPTPHKNILTQSAYALEATNSNCGGKTAASWKKQAAHDAAGFLLDQIRAHPGEITLIAIGPLFNVQAAIEHDPETFRKLKRVVMMGGSINRGYYDGKTHKFNPPDAEWNIVADPAGAKALLASGVPIYMMPLDSTQIHLEAENRDAIFSHGSPLTDQLTLLYYQWHAQSDGHWTTPTLFDVVAAAYAIRPELCPASPMHLEVDDKGFTRQSPGAPNAQVCLQSDETSFLDLFMNRLTKEPAQ